MEGRTEKLLLTLEALGDGAKLGDWTEQVTLEVASGMVHLVAQWEKRRPAGRAPVMAAVANERAARQEEQAGQAPAPQGGQAGPAPARRSVRLAGRGQPAGGQAEQAEQAEQEGQAEQVEQAGQAGQAQRGQPQEREAAVEEAAYEAAYEAEAASRRELDKRAEFELRDPMLCKYVCLDAESDKAGLIREWVTVPAAAKTPKFGFGDANSYRDQCRTLARQMVEELLEFLCQAWVGKSAAQVKVHAKMQMQRQVIEKKLPMGEPLAFKVQAMRLLKVLNEVFAGDVLGVVTQFLTLLDPAVQFFMPGPDEATVMLNPAMGGSPAKLANRAEDALRKALKHKPEIRAAAPVYRASTQQDSKPKDDSWKQNIECFKCREKGHISRECKKKKKKSQSGGANAPAQIARAGAEDADVEWQEMPLLWREGSRRESVPEATLSWLWVQGAHACSVPESTSK